MPETKKAHLLDIVELTEDLPEYGVRRGERGAVVEVFDSPEEAYIIEFVDKSGISSRLAYGVKPHQFKPAGDSLEMRKKPPPVEARHWFVAKSQAYEVTTLMVHGQGEPNFPDPETRRKIDALEHVKVKWDSVKVVDGEVIFMMSILVGDRLMDVWVRAGSPRPQSPPRRPHLRADIGPGTDYE